MLSPGFKAHSIIWNMKSKISVSVMSLTTHSVATSVLATETNFNSPVNICPPFNGPDYVCIAYQHTESFKLEPRLRLFENIDHHFTYSLTSFNSVLVTLGPSNMYRNQ